MEETLEGIAILVPITLFEPHRAKVIYGCQAIELLKVKDMHFHEMDKDTVEETQYGYLIEQLYISVWQRHE